MIRGVSPGNGASVKLLGTGESLRWEKQGEDLKIALPPYDPSWGLPDEAYVFVISQVDE